MSSRSERPQSDARKRAPNPHRELLESIFVELFQSERSAEVHPPVEAMPLGDSAPARALRAVSQHALSVREELAEQARRRGLRVTRSGRRIGDAFSWARRTFTDPSMELERSYRATLLGMRHGLDLVKLLRAAAESADDAELAAWCTEFLAVREPLVEDVCSQLAWFGWHPERAIQHRGRARGLLDRLFGRGDRSPPPISPVIGEV